MVFEGPLPPAEATDGPLVTTPRASLTASARALHRPRAKRAGPPTALIVTALLFAPALAWFAIVFVPRLLEEKPAARIEPPLSAARSGTEGELERRLGELKTLLVKKDPPAEAASRIESLYARIRELQAELEEERARDRSSRSSPAPAPAAVVRPVEALIPDADLDRAETLPEPPARLRGPRVRTGVSKASPVPRKLTDREIGNLVTTLTKRIDDYATRLVSPQSLEPELTGLSSSAGKGAAAGVLAVHDHARKLLRDVDETIERNELRREALLRRAEAEKAAEKRPNSQTEAEQRTLDLSSKAAEIFRSHRVQLVGLRDAVLASLVRLRDPEAIAHLRSRFLDDMDVDLDKACAKAFAAAGSRDSVQALIQRLGVARDPGLRTALARSLSAITGKDFGEKASEWAQWWGRQGQ